VLQKATPVYPYEPNSWGPNEMERVTPPGGWQNPVVAPETSAVAGQAA
jgi:glucose-6-phosphate 1-dehydrogenase